ncbi:hypothetical protein [Actinoplanes sp. NPDC049599]|uniref:hypothetical protein n=1 Tax=Actinoplanes sp. NPDC049599 TaxID=3363903 RepID=UPI0037A5DA75
MIDPTMAWRLDHQDDRQHRAAEHARGTLIARVRRSRWWRPLRRRRVARPPTARPPSTQPADIPPVTDPPGRRPTAGSPARR